MGLLWRLLTGLAAYVLVVHGTLDWHGIDLAQPAAKIDLLAAATAEGHGLAGGGVELLFADGATDHS